MSELYIGLMSGTSADGIDAALVSFEQNKPQLIKTHYQPYDEPLRQKILSLCQSGENEILRLGELDHSLGKAFAKAAIDLCSIANAPTSAVKAIGSHGQTVRHVPQKPYPFTLQIGDPNIIACETGITTVTDFRRKDMAAGGQGAPLVPAFHHAMFPSPSRDLAVVNIGGMANVTLLPKSGADIIGYDTGPGNVLMDSWIQEHLQKNHDEQGSWGVTGSINQALLDRLLGDPYFNLQPPKSTGREYFNLSWVKSKIKYQALKTVDVQATLVELTAKSILTAISKHFKNADIYICGGGAHNNFLMSRLIANAGVNFAIQSTQQVGIHPDWVEAMAFAWLAYQRINNLPGNLPKVTGATKPLILGGLYLPN